MNRPKIKYRPIKTNGIPQMEPKPHPSSETPNSQKIANPPHKSEKGIRNLSSGPKLTLGSGPPRHNIRSPGRIQRRVPAASSQFEADSGTIQQYGRPIRCLMSCGSFENDSRRERRPWRRVDRLPAVRTPRVRTDDAECPSVIIGPRTPEQLDDLLAGANVVLSDEVLDRIDEIVPPGSELNPDDNYQRQWFTCST
jgi:hypothetical protein